jgi:hypothetical protein
MSRKDGEIEVDAAGFPVQLRSIPIKGVMMGGTGPKNNPPDKESGAPAAPPPPIEDDDSEDGDMATPKRDRTGNDDEPL